VICDIIQQVRPCNTLGTPIFFDKSHKIRILTYPMKQTELFKKGIRDGIPIGLGYLAVSFSLGITAKLAGLTPFQGFLTSLLENASAGEYVCFTLIAAGASYLEVFVMTLIANARYLLMSCALSQHFSPDTPWYHRLLISFDLTDELFGLAISRPGYLEPAYMYGAFLVALPAWSGGTALGIIAGSLLPTNIVSALSVALYGMFIAIIFPPARKNKVILGLILTSFVLSLASRFLPLISSLSSGSRTIILTLLIAGIAAVLFPVKDEGT
jgi:predicted branched-subunit amino acid permease